MSGDVCRECGRGGGGGRVDSMVGAIAGAVGTDGDVAEALGSFALVVSWVSLVA